MLQLPVLHMVAMQERLVLLPNIEFCIYFQFFAGYQGYNFHNFVVQIVGRVLSTMQSHHGAVRIEEHPEHLLQALREALALVGTVKCYDPSTFLLH